VGQGTDNLTSAALLKEAKAFHTKKALGQHFLVEADVLQTIADALCLSESDTVVEIGPGIGFLTRFLSTTGATIIAVDLDRQAVSRLESMQLPNVMVKHGDFLRFNLNTLAFSESKKDVQSGTAGERLKIAGNVPYQITGLILGHLLGEIDRASAWLSSLDTVVVTVQYEVAKRMVAKAGQPDYSKLSLLVDYYCQATIEAVVPPECFYPAPQVTSAIVKLKPRNQPAVSCRNPKLLKHVIEAGFRQRRKMLRNSLAFLKLGQTQINSAFDQLGIDPQVRPERLSIAQFAKLADVLEVSLKDHAHTESPVTSKDQSDL
jgi:16S rRNA (adenine1518-N6/adenine1519-N6)-dimethyltransferase